ncbi:MAG: CsgG/HfaB family protein [Desulforhopalus sp.]|nr:CsgG/HfaB family protein [Desulforhopalus sp.]
MHKHDLPLWGLNMEKQFSGSWARLLCCVFLVVAGMATVQAAAKPTVAVLDFESIGSEDYLGKAVAEIMRTELVGTDRFRVVERAQIKQALTEQTLQLSGTIDTASVVQLGKLLGADQIIVGSVVKIGSAYTINSRMIDVKTGEARLGRNVTGDDLNLLTSLSRDLISGLFGTEKKGGAADPSAARQPAPAAPAAEKIAAVAREEKAGRIAVAAAGPAITWDFETGDQRGWTSAGEAFSHQPTYGDNPTARNRGQASAHQGNYWIGGFELRPNPSFPAGGVQGDGPQGTLTSQPFTISSSTISFLIGGGCDLEREYVQLLINGRTQMKATGWCHETMQRMYWNVANLQGHEARIQLVDRSSEGWGHINADDFRFE